jgi:proline iminopeptidase
VLGHSHGGAIALGYAIRYPDHIRKLILVDSNVQDFDTRKIIQQQLEARRRDKRYEASVNWEMSDTRSNTDEEFGASLKRELALYFYDPDVGMPLLARTAPSLPSIWVRRANSAADERSPIKEDSVMDQIHVDTLVLVGENDWICPPVVAERIHAAIQGSAIQIFSHCGHFPWIEQPAAFFAAVKGFLSQK